MTNQLLGIVFQEPPLPVDPKVILLAQNDNQPQKTLLRGVFNRSEFWIFLIVLLNLLFFSDALFTDKTFFFRDVSFFHYPLKRLVTEAYARGEWPLWNPYIQLGQPLLANPNSMAFYPTQILFQILSFETAFELHFVLHCILAGIATFFLGRRLGLSAFSAFLSAVIYNYSGVTLSFVNLFNILPVVAYLPLLTLLLLRFLDKVTFLRLAVTSLVFGFFFLLLEPLSSIAIALFLGGFLGAYLYFSGKVSSARLRPLGWALLASSSGLLLASIQILPTLELIQHSGRRSGLDFGMVAGWSMHPIMLLQLGMPRIFGDYFRLTQSSSWASVFFENREPYLLSCYLGMFPLLLGFFAICNSGVRWMTRTLALLLGISLILAIGKYSPVYPWLFHHCPLFRYGRYPVKYLLVSNFCISLLAGIGFDRICEMRKEYTIRQLFRKRGFIAFCLIAGIIFIIAAGIMSFLEWRNVKQSTDGAEYFQFFTQGKELLLSKLILAGSVQHLRMQLGLFAIFLILVWIRKIRWHFLHFAVVLIILFDLLTSNFWINPVIRDELYETAPAAVYLQEKMKQEGLFRIYSLGNPEAEKDPLMLLGNSDSIAWQFFYRKLTLAQFLSAKDHIQYSVFQPVDRLETLPSQAINEELTKAASSEEKLSLLAGLNVGYVLAVHHIDSGQVALDSEFEVNSPQPLRLYRVLNKLPRAFLVNSDKSQSDALAYREYLSVQSPSASVKKDEREARQPSLGAVKILSYLPNRVEMEATTDQKRILVLVDSYYPDWKATVDGQDVPVIAANYVYKAIELPLGQHRISVYYQPKSFTRGLYLTLGTILVWLLSWPVWWISSKRGAALRHALA